MPKLYFEDFFTGHVAEYGPRVITREEIVGFASEFDPQPMHLEEEAGSASMLGGLAASGWHSCSILMRIIADGFIVHSSSMGANAVDEVKWLRPVRPGDSLTVRATVQWTRTSRSRPDLGVVKFLFEMFNAQSECVLTMIAPVMFGRRAGTTTP